MRKIKFKAIAVEDFKRGNIKVGDWCVGHSLSQFESGRIEIDGVYCDPATLCQFTGITDRDGKEIWENDRVSFSISYRGKFKGEYEGYVRYHEAGFVIRNGVAKYFFGGRVGNLRVLGNLHDEYNQQKETEL